MMPHYVYILECDNHHFYTGYTTDLERRYREHQQGSIKSKYTRSFAPQRIAAYWCFDSKSRALKVEYQLKRLSHTQKSALIDLLFSPSGEVCTENST
jgi:putative endonuclease